MCASATTGGTPSPTAPWRTPDVWGIVFSAFFADLGYQAILAVFPLYLVLDLGAPIWLFGLSQALAYGPGAFFGYLGGRLGDRYGRWVVSVAGNAFIPLMALAGLSSAPPVAVALLVTGWWARNLRSPPRRALLVDSVDPGHQGPAFGFLHALDVGGGMLAAVYAFLLVLTGVSYSTILLVTVAPLVVSTLVLLRVRGGRKAPSFLPSNRPSAAPSGAESRPHRALFRGVLAATVLYGFASFSIGFPVLTTVQGTREAADGVLVFVVALGVSSLVGLLAGSVRRRRLAALALGGYLVAAAGSALLALAIGVGLGLAAFLGGAAVLGAALGTIETFEPTLVAAISPTGTASRNFGALSAFRSLGLFASNVVFGLLTVASAWYPYAYAAVGAAAAAVLLLALRPAVGTLGDARA